MSDSRLVFLDIDGTIMGHDQRIPASALAACHAAVERGHTLIMCTGRSIPEIYPNLWELGFTGAISGAGGHVQIGDDVLVDRRIGAPDVETITRVWESLGGMYIWQGPDAMHPCDGFLEFFVPLAGIAADDWRVYADAIAPYIRPGLPTSTGKTTVYIPRANTTPEEVRELIPSDYSVTLGSVEADNMHVFEIAPADISKGTGVRLIAEHLGRPIAETIAVGDSYNDIEALRAAGIGVAMGQAAPEVQAAADYVTAPLADDGLAKAFEHFGLNS